MQHTEFNSILKSGINNLETKIHTSLLDNDTSYLEKSGLYQMLKEDPRHLAHVESEFLKSLVEQFDFSDDVEKEDFFNELQITSTLYALNERGAEIPLEKSQIEVVNSFLTQLEQAVFTEQKLQEKRHHSKQTEELTLDKYKQMAGILRNSDSKELIADLDGLQQLFVQQGLFESEKRGALLFLMGENQKKAQSSFVPEERAEKTLPPTPKLEIEEVEKLFAKYDYDFNSIKKEMQEDLLTYGSIHKMDEIFQTLKKQHYPKIEEKKKSQVLTAILIGSSKEVIEKNTALALEKGISPRDILDISGCLLLQSKKKGEEDTPFLIERNQNSYMPGSAQDFRDNIQLLETYGLSVGFVYEKCKHLLTFSNKTLANNLELFSEYSFSLENQRNKISDPSLSALLSTQFAEIADMFIEIHPLGMQYLRDNMSNLKTRTSANDLVFYNIYQSLQGDFATGPFRQIVDQNKTSLQMRGEITRYTSTYRNQPYCGITQDNKREITQTIVPEFAQKEKYDQILKDSQDQSIDASIFYNEYIQKIDEYTDKNEPLAYNFDGIRISKLKVLRVYHTLLENGVEQSPDSFLYAVSYNTLINQDNFDKLSTLVTGKVKEGRGQK